MTFGLFMDSAASLLVLVALAGRVVVWVIERLPD